MGATPKLANSEALAVIQQGAKAWNEWRKNKQGPSLNLTGADLRGVDLSNANLRNAKLLGKDTLLWNANLSNADLYQTNFRGADLQDVNFASADLYQADLRESNLQGADLSTAKGGLLSRQFAGSDLTGAKLPEPLAKLYSELSSAKEISSNAQKLFLALLAGCLYSWLTIAQTTDVELITNRATTPLPVIQAAIPIVGFYVVAPLILLCLYFYFHFYLQKLWEELGSLPAVFTDGRELHKRTDPWLLNDLVRSHFVKLKDGRPFLSYFQSWISVVLAWWLVPITLFAFWLRFMRRHDLFWTMGHALLLTVAIFSAVQLYSIANRTLRGEERPGLRFKGILKRRSTCLQASFAALLGALVIAMSLGTIFGDAYWPPGSIRMGLQISSPRTWMPWLVNRIGYYPFANLKNADVSVKPPNWTGKKEGELELVKAASLAGMNLRHADAAGGFFVMANLESAHIEGAHLPFANLQQGDLDLSYLDYANLLEANLRQAQLRGARLSDATLALANLSQANLSNANLRGADLSWADLTSAHLNSADLTNANLFGARLKYADFRMTLPLRRQPLNLDELLHTLENPSVLMPEMLHQANDWQLAFYDFDMLKQLGLPPDHNEKLQKQMEAEQQQAKSVATTPTTPK